MRNAPPRNRLADETSPYLLQHAGNPVDWYPWGEDAIAEARRRGVPIFLSIGYSTCYWCHVMERESFEDDATARVMNERFVCVKVDREERPDLDDAYMTATQVLTGSGGWPMSVFIEPTGLRPYWCGTYFPRKPTGQMPSFTQVLEAMSAAYADRRDEVLEQAGQLGDAVADALSARREAVGVGSAQVAQGVESLLRAYDRTHGGFGGAPKFPQPVFIAFLLRARSVVDETTRTAIDGAVRHTLDRMAVGGLFDHVGGGFHRYCVDGTWTVPHFEKMLYDNAQLVSVFATAARLYDDAWYSRVIRRAVDCVFRDMADPACEPGASGFYSAIDAEVDRREGLNYLWTPEQLTDALGEDDGAFAAQVYGVAAGANFRDPHFPEDGAKSVLRLSDRPDRLVDALGMPQDALSQRLDSINERLHAVRCTREQPHTDDKVLACWNGLMISALVDAAGVLEGDDLLDAAERAAGFVFERLRTRDGALARSWRAGTPGGAGFLDDHAAMASACLSLHRVRPDGGWLDRAVTLVGDALESFSEKDGSGRVTAVFDARGDAGAAFVRGLSTQDGAVPSGAGMLLNALVGLADATGDEVYRDRAVEVLAVVSSAIAGSPVSVANGLIGLLALLEGGAVAPGAGDESRVDDEDDAAFTPVEIYASDDRVAVAPRRPAAITLRVRVHPDHHLIAADPWPDGTDLDDAPALVPLRVDVAGGAGVAVYADYPPGDVEGEPPVRTHRGEFEIPVVIEQSGEVSGRPIVTVRYQACTDRACLEPAMVELDVAIDTE